MEKWGGEGLYDENSLVSDQQLAAIWNENIFKHEDVSDMKTTLKMDNFGASSLESP